MNPTQGYRIINYRCYSCGNTIMTRQLHEGETRYWIRCDACPGVRRPVDDRPLFVHAPTHEWYAPKSGIIMVSLYDTAKALISRPLLQLRLISAIPSR